MIAYIKGRVAIVQADSLVVDVNGVGYEIFIGHPYEYQVDQDILIHTYNHIREDINTLYGFSTIEEKQLYNRLLSVKGRLQTRNFEDENSKKIYVTEVA